MKKAVFWVIAVCRLVKVYLRLGRPYCLQHQGDEASIMALMMDAVRLYAFTSLQGATTQKTISFLLSGFCCRVSFGLSYSAHKFICIVLNHSVYDCTT
jgi:hypothetical protein